MTLNIQGLRKFISPEIIFGRDSRFLAAQYCLNYQSKHVLLVSDRGVIERGWLDDIKSNLRERNIRFSVFSGFSPNPRASEVMEGAQVFRENNCDIIVAIGGGSPMDGAKGIGIVATNGGGILDFEGVNRIKNPLPPMIFIPTTAGTSADVSQFAIINNKDDSIKIAILSKMIIPDVSLIDPVTTLSMDSYLTACTGMDALVHAVEAYVSIAHSPMTDTHALEAIRVLVKHLPEVIDSPRNMESREMVMFGSLEAGLAFSNAILGAVHAMSHSLGGLLDLPHGECNSLLLEHVVNYNYSVVPERYNRIAEICGIETEGMKDKEISKALFLYIRDFRSRLGINKTLRDCGVSLTDIPLLAKKAYHDACLQTNPRKSCVEDLEAIFEEAY